MMTEDEMIVVTESALAEWESLLAGKIRDGTQPYTKDAVEAKSTFKGSIEAIDERQFRDEISRVLQRLQALDTFFMSEPKAELLRWFPTAKTVRHGKLLVTLMIDGEVVSNVADRFNHIVCWYYPA